MCITEKNNCRKRLGLVIENLYYNNVEDAAKIESSAGPAKNERSLLDFKNRFTQLFGADRNSLLAVDGKAYNANEGGNYLWGMVLEYSGIFISPNLIAKKGSGTDEWWDQKAITSGRKKAISLNITATEQELIFEVRMRYRAGYQEYLKNGGTPESYKPSDELGIFKEGREKYHIEQKPIEPLK